MLNDPNADWESPATRLFVGIIVALALVAIGYLIFVEGAPIKVDLNQQPATEQPAAQ
jgi:hypothetical protein